MSKRQTSTSPEKPASKSRRSYVSQSDVPGYSLDQALRIPTAIVEQYNGASVTPLQLASAVMMSPSSGPFRQLCGASIAYGLTTGGYNAQEVTLEPLARRILEPLKEGDELAAKREAIVRPRVLREFLQKYDGAMLPRHDIALNVLIDMGVPRDKSESVYTLILDSAEEVGFIREIKGKQYIDMNGCPSGPEESPAISGRDSVSENDETHDKSREVVDAPNSESLPSRQERCGSPETNRRVFVTHGKNREFIEPIKKLLGFGELTLVVSVERQSVSKPVPDKVMADMRSCGAAIIHVDAEQTLLDEDANEHVVINSNVLLEIGAAIALYGQRIILLVREGVNLPSNLQGLYQVRYASDSLDGDTTIRLLEAINDIKNHAIPDRHIVPKNATAGD